MNANQNEARETNQFHRFRVYQSTNLDSSTEKPKTVGMAYLKEGQEMYTLRLWTFLESKFFLIPSKKVSGMYLLMTREPTKSPQSKTKYFWNIVGNAHVDSKNMRMEIEFDLFEKKAYMSLFPENQPVAKNLPEPPIDFESFDAAA